MGTIISDSKSFIFVHVPKTAGLSVASRLDPYRRNAWLDRKPLRSAMNLAGAYSGVRIEPWFGGKIVPEHAGLADLVALDPGLDLNGYFKFAIVRNPWDRLASLFAYHHGHARTRYLRPGYWKTRKMGFSDWLRFHADRRRAGQIRSQFDMVRAPGGRGLGVDKLIRFETLADDFADVATRIGLADGTLPALNRSANTDFRRRYSDEDAALVAEVYADDVREFGYEF